MTVVSGGLADPRVDVAALKDACPLDVVVPAYAGVELRPRGAALVGRCPFHDDGGRPNLHVYPATRSWYCYRCHAGGDVIAFVQRATGLTFAEACRRLAERLPARPVAANRRLPVPEPRRWDRLSLEEQVVMNTAAALYQHRLWQTHAALDYLRRRGVPDHVIRARGLGYADGHSLEAFLRRRSGLRIAQDLGLLRKPDPRDDGRPLREHLAGRIVVPELRGGSCIWLIGRTMYDDSGRPKYLALGGERPVLGYECAAGAREVFLCEGVFDWLTAVAWGLAAWSPCGTALPAERLGFLARARAVYGVLDADAAGAGAAARFGALLGDRWRPIPLPDGCDLNDLGRQAGGRTEFFRRLAQARRATPPEQISDHAKEDPHAA